MAFGFRPVFRRLLVINKIYHKGRRPKAGFGLVVSLLREQSEAWQEISKRVPRRSHKVVQTFAEMKKRKRRDKKVRMKK